MNTQTLTTPIMTCKFVATFPVANYPSEEAIRASSLDYGFDFDEEELASELPAPLPAALPRSAISEVEADEFERVFRYFVS